MSETNNKKAVGKKSGGSGSLIKGIVLFLVVGVGGGYGFVWTWMMSRVSVDPGEMLIIKSNMGKENKDPNIQVVEQGYKGILKEVYGEGRHFFNPFLFERRLYRSYRGTVLIKPMEIGVVVSKSGKPLPGDRYLVNDANVYKGIWRVPLTPGKWRMNPFAYKIQRYKAITIRPGYVGCITSLALDPETNLKGILPKVLQPGIYYINPKAYRVEEVEIGYRHISLGQIKFKSIDSFDIQLDVSVVWGVKPANVKNLIENLGNVDAIVDKIIQPQVNTIVRLEGSKLKARDLIAGKTRERFQNTFTKRLEKVCNEKKIEILIGLVRNISIPQEVRDPINQAKIALEEQKMKVEMKQTQVIKNKLEELKEDVQKGIREVKATTKRIIAKIKADGQRQVLKIKGKKEVEVAKIMRQVAEIEAKIELVKGTARAKVIELTKRAKSDEFRQFARALGSGSALSKYIFTKNLRKDLQIHMRYSGPGTFWTDMSKGMNFKRAASAKILSTPNRR